MVARTTPARRAISAMLTSGSLASASRAASVIAEMLRSASARRRLGADASVSVFVLDIDSVDRHRLWVELQLREEVLRAWENRHRHHAGETSDESGDQERVPDPRRRLRAEDRSACSSCDRGEDRDPEGAADLVTGRIQAGDHSALFVACAGEDRRSEE